MNQISKADFDYFNGGIGAVTTDSSTLISSSKYLNHAGLRALISQEMLRKNGADMPTTAYIPQVAMIFGELADRGELMRLLAEEREKNPVFAAWLDRRHLSDFTAEELKDSRPGTLGARIYDFLANSGFDNDLFYRGMKIENDFQYYQKERVFTHDIEHMVTGFGPNFCGEIALLSANLQSFYSFFTPGLVHHFATLSGYLYTKSMMKANLHYPVVMPAFLEATRLGIEQGARWKKPLLLAQWRDYLDWPIPDLREELGIGETPPDGYWDWTSAASGE